MVKYKVPDSAFDEINKNRVLSVITYYTLKEGGIDLDKVNPTTLAQRYGISLADAKKAVQALILEGKVEKV